MLRREAMLHEREVHVAEAKASLEERERRLDVLTRQYDAAVLSVSVVYWMLRYLIDSLLPSRLASLAMREIELDTREAEVVKHAKEVQSESERNEAMRQELEKLELEAQQKELRQAATTNPHTAAYHVQSGTTASKFQAVIDGVATRSKIPAERFFSAEPEHTYPLVLLFVKPSGPRLADGVVKYDEVELCRTMVATGGSLLICTMRAGNDPQAAKDLPAGCPPVEGLLDFCYISGSAQQPHVLNPSSKMNHGSATELAKVFRRLVPPPPPPPRPQPRHYGSRFAWL